MQVVGKGRRLDRERRLRRHGLDRLSPQLAGNAPQHDAHDPGDLTVDDERRKQAHRLC